MFQGTFELLAKQRSNDTIKTMPLHLNTGKSTREISINSNEMQPIPD